MTIVCWKRPYLVSDSRLTEDGNIITDQDQKIWEFTDGSLIGLAGDKAEDDLIKLFSRTKKLPTRQQIIKMGVKFESLIILSTGVWYVNCHDIGTDIIEIREPFFAIGSAYKYALGAMAAGASAKKAVEIACRYDTACGGKIQQYKLESPE